MYSKTLAYLEIDLIAILSSSRRGYKTSPIARCFTKLTGFLVSKGGGAAAGLYALGNDRRVVREIEIKKGNIEPGSNQVVTESRTPRYRKLHH